MEMQVSEARAGTVQTALSSRLPAQLAKRTPRAAGGGLVAAALLFTGCSQATPAPETATPTRTVEHAVWLRAPETAEYNRTRPQSPESQRTRGEVTLDCAVTDTGTLKGCRIDSESPTGMGFGASAMKMSDFYRLDMPQSQAQAGDRIVVTTLFFPEQPQARGGSTSAANRPASPLNAILPGTWEITFEDDPDPGRCDSTKETYQRDLYIFQGDGGLEFSHQHGDATGKWIATANHLLLQFRNDDGTWSDINGSAGATTVAVKALSNDHLILTPTASNSATERLRRCRF